MSHYYDQSPESEHNPGIVKARIGGVDLTFHTDAGVFSKNQLDFGTRLLIETVLEEVHQSGQPMHGSLLDLGCGYGPIGIAFKRRFPSLQVVMVDINSRAIELARENASENQIRYPDIRNGDGTSVLLEDERFDHVLTNPPVRAGKETVHAFFEGAYRHLKPGGSLYVVLQKKQGAPSARDKLTDLFGNCTILERKAGYHILKSTRLPMI